MKRIVFEDFLKESEGVIFSYAFDYGRCGYDGLYYKGVTICDESGVGVNYFYNYLTPVEGEDGKLRVGFGYRFLDDVELKDKVRLKHVTQDHMYVVYEEEDLEVLRKYVGGGAVPSLKKKRKTN